MITCSQRRYQLKKKHWDVGVGRNHGDSTPHTKLKTLERNLIVLDFELKQGHLVHLKAPLIHAPPLSSPAHPLGLSDPRPLWRGFTRRLWRS